jgi:hypothetical protein
MATTVTVLTSADLITKREIGLKGTGFSALGTLQKADGTVQRAIYDPTGDVIYVAPAGSNT